jgi:hypothetical protein
MERHILPILAPNIENGFEEKFEIKLLNFFCAPDVPHD